MNLSGITVSNSVASDNVKKTSPKRRGKHSASTERLSSKKKKKNKKKGKKHKKKRTTKDDKNENSYEYENENENILKVTDTS